MMLLLVSLLLLLLPAINAIRIRGGQSLSAGQDDDLGFHGLVLAEGLMFGEQQPQQEIVDLVRRFEDNVGSFRKAVVVASNRLLVEFWHEKGKLWGALDHKSWREKEVKYMTLTQHGQDMKIMEPCNMVSNLPFYWTCLRVLENHDEWYGSAEFVEQAANSFLLLGFGSTFYHGAETELGSFLDRAMVAQIAHLCIYRIQPQNHASALETSRNITRMLLRHELDDFGKNVVVEMDMHAAFATIAVVVGHLCIGSNQTEYLLKQISPKEIMDTDAKTLLLGKLGELDLPELNRHEKLLIGRHFAGAALKLVYAALFQEELFPMENEDDWLEFVTWGNENLQNVVQNADMIAGKPTNHDEYSHYPGANHCKTQPHSLWHMAASEGLYDLLVTCDVIGAVLTKQINATTTLDDIQLGNLKGNQNQIAEKHIDGILRKYIGSVPGVVKELVLGHQAR